MDQTNWLAWGALCKTLSLSVDNQLWTDNHLFYCFMGNYYLDNWDYFGSDFAAVLFQKNLLVVRTAPNGIGRWERMAEWKHFWPVTGSVTIPNFGIRRAC